MGKSSSPSIPKAPKPGPSYGQGVQTYMQYLPGQLAAENQNRTMIDPQRINEQQQLQKTYGPTQYAQQIGAFEQLDPQYGINHQQLGADVSKDLALGTSMSPQQREQMQQNVRGAQEARGNIYGGAAADAEAYALGDKGQQLYQQRLANMGSYLAEPNMAQLTSSVAPISADRSYGYVNPNAGFQGQQFAQQNYANQIGAAGVQAAGQQNPWGTAIGALGSIAGAYAGSAYSDKRLKENIQQVGTDPQSGVPIKEFNFKQKPGRFRGVIAQDVEKRVPGAVSIDPQTGVKGVNYGKLGMKMRRVK